jgi:ankyrin repeat protein
MRLLLPPVPQDVVGHRREQITSSLKFTDMNQRRFSIKKSLRSTCRWLLVEAKYTSWMNNAHASEHTGFIWLKGKPGAGKSTIMRFAFEQHKETHDSANADIGKHLLASFFFHARGTSLQKSTIGMYRSLLYQLLTGYTDLQVLLDDSELLPSTDAETFSLGQLEELFGRAIGKLGDRQFICYIDALDECLERDLATLLHTLQDLAEDSNREKLHFRVFISSRHYPNIQKRIGLQIELDYHPGHFEDMRHYVETRLLYHDTALARKLIQKASGVFLWVILVVQLLNADQSEGYSISSVDRRLEHLPDNLSSLFQEILSRHKGNTDEFILSVAWILHTTRPLTPEEFEHAVWSAAGSSDSTRPPRQVKAFKDDTIRFRHRVTSASKGFAEITEQEGSATVQFIHESVREFFLGDYGLARIWPHDEGTVLEHAIQDLLKQCCHRYLSLSALRSEVSQVVGNDILFTRLVEHFPLLRYAAQNILYHADRAARTIDQNHFLSTFSVTWWIKGYNIFTNDPKDTYHLETELLYLLADRGHALLIHAWARPLPMKIVSFGWYGSPLIAALARNHTAAVSALLKLPTNLCVASQLLNGAWSDSFRSKVRSRSLLSWAAEMGFPALVKALIWVDAPVNGVDLGDYTALGRAVLSLTPKTLQSIHGLVVKTLLQHGAKWESASAIQPSQEQPDEMLSLMRDRYDRKLFQWSVANEAQDQVFLLLKDRSPARAEHWLTTASRWGNMEAMQQLINTGANVNETGSPEDGESSDMPLTAALKSAQYIAAESLLQHGADIWTDGNWRGSIFREAVEQDDTPLLPWLIHHTLESDRCRVFGATPLVHAAQCGSNVAIKLLLQAGADVNARDPGCNSALLASIIDRKPETTELLILFGADVNMADKEGDTALMHACLRSHTTAQLLIRSGAYVDAKMTNGWTALMVAARNGFLRTARLLLDGGANVRARDSQGRSALELAELFPVEGVDRSTSDALVTLLRKELLRPRG